LRLSFSSYSFIDAALALRKQTSSATNNNSNNNNNNNNNNIIDVTTTTPTTHQFPTQQNGSILIPSVQYLREPPFMKSTPTHYFYFYIHHLSQVIDIDVKEEERIIIWKFSPLLNFLLPEALVKTTAFIYYNIKEVNNETDSMISNYVTKIPEDAILEEIEVKRVNIPSGKLVEVFMPRKKQLNRSNLLAPRRSNLDARTKTTVKLEHSSISDSSDSERYSREESSEGDDSERYRSSDRDSSDIM
jgi:hypothetical protein